MFDELLKQLGGLSGGTAIPIQVPLDDDGYYDRRCPSQNCGSRFKVLFEDWKTEKVRDERVYCPICRAEYPAQDWNTSEQNEHIQQAALAHVQRVIGQALQTDARRFNQAQPKNGFLSLRLSYRPESPVIVLPPTVAEALEQRFVCEKCQVRYAVLGMGFFCPACGHSSIVEIFFNQLSVIRKRIDSFSDLRQTVGEVMGKDAAENTVRTLLEGALRDLVGLFQHFVEGLFLKLPASSGVKLPKNVFQRLKDGSDLWGNATGQTYERLIGSSRVAALNRLFQRRHLIEHRGSLVDREYLDKTSDPDYAIGQRLVVQERDILELLSLVEDLGMRLRALVP